MMESAERTEWKPTNDIEADWCIQKVRKAKDAMVLRVEHYRRQIEIAQKECEETEASMCAMLSEYMGTVPCHTTKTQRSYPFPSGKVVISTQGPEFKRNDTQMVDWMRTSGNNSYIKEKVLYEPDWAELKKKTEVENGYVVMADTREIVIGVEVIPRPEKVTIKFGGE